MRRHATILACLAAWLASACAPRATPLPRGRLVDLTHSFDAQTVYWPTEEGFVLERGFAGRTEGGYWYSAHRFHAAEHGGTHVDAPIHFGEGRRSVDEIPLDALVAQGCVVDVRAAADRDRDYRVSVADLDAWEAEHGALPAGAIVLLRTGWSERWPDRERYLGSARRGAAGAAELHFPGLDDEAARRLVERRIAAVGIDTASIDHGPSRDFASHRVLAEAQIPAFENLARLDELPASGFGVIALPMKIAAGSGAPLRILAVVP